MKFKFFNFLYAIFILAMMTLTMSSFSYVNVSAIDNYQSTVKDITGQVKEGAVIFIVMSALATGILYLSSPVNPNGKNQGKKALYGLIVGIVILLLANDIAGWIATAVMHEDISDVYSLHLKIPNKGK